MSLGVVLLSVVVIVQAGNDMDPGVGCGVGRQFWSVIAADLGCGWECCYDGGEAVRSVGGTCIVTAPMTWSEYGTACSRFASPGPSCAWDGVRSLEQ